MKIIVYTVYYENKAFSFQRKTDYKNKNNSLCLRLCVRLYIFSRHEINNIPKKLHALYTLLPHKSK